MARILLITSQPYHTWKGTCHRLRHTLEALSALGYETDLLTPPLDALPVVPGITHRATLCPPLLRNLPEGPSLRRMLVGGSMLAKAVHLIGRGDYTLAHGFDDGGAVACAAGRLTGLPAVYERTTDFTAKRERDTPGLWHRFYLLTEKRAMKRAAAIIGNDASLLPLLARLKLRSRACIIPDIPALETVVAPQLARMAQARHRTAKKQKLVTCIGSYSRFQGLDLFFNAIPHVLLANHNTRFVVVGGNEGEIARMRAALEQAAVADAVSFTGRIPPEELAALLSVSDVLVSPRRAGLSAPIKVLDYLNCGKPVVAADTPANRAILSPENAVITRPRPEALAAGIVGVCKSPNLGKALAARGRQTLLREHRTPQDFRESLSHCYDYVLSTSGNHDRALR